MRAVVSRVTAASVVVEGEVVGQITEPGLLVLLGVTVETGRFGAMMDVASVNDGPFTVIVEV